MAALNAYVNIATVFFDYRERFYCELHRGCKIILKCFLAIKMGLNKSSAIQTPGNDSKQLLLTTIYQWCGNIITDLRTSC